jgi:hypothetical protein
MMREVSICCGVVSHVAYLGRVALRGRVRVQVVQNKRIRHTLEPSGVGNVWRSTTVMEVYAKSGFLQSAHAVERPKAPLPTMMTDLGTLRADDEEAGEDIAQHDTRMHAHTSSNEEEQCLLQGQFSQIHTAESC